MKLEIKLDLILITDYTETINIDRKIILLLILKNV